METPLSVIITTYNRKTLLKRCLDSVKNQKYSNYQIIVVDDHSEPSYENEIISEYPDIKYIVQEENGGPGIARNTGILIADNNYVILMDDDDVFKEEAFTKINSFIQTSFDNSFPVFNFLISNARVEKICDYHIYSFKELIEGKLQGDLLHVINKKSFLEVNDYKFPNYKIGAESLLWYKIALDYGLPVVNEVLVNLGEDAKDRLTNIDRQVNSSLEFASFQLSIIKNYQSHLLTSGNKNFLIKKYQGAIMYLLLSGQKLKAIYYWIKLFKYTYKHILLLFLFILPKKSIIQLLKIYRKV
ncbi:glycosyltransferase family 2 protein [Sporosarcina siberiensis]|uniref:Glycosyltransferase family 2 protein n=1 Tax=Sporosarcina siberiensis TaxID=1365606 RepID=A0ABW4SI71_9BACL